MRRCAFLFLFSLTSGCSIHPQTEDLSRNILPEIIHKIRCEARAAVLREFPDKGYYLRQAGVNFDFDFELVENNDATAEGTVVLPMVWGTFTAGWDAGMKNQRQTTQVINITDAFKNLVALTDCGPGLPRRNYVYPITGEIGLATTFRNFRLVVENNSGLIKEFSDEVKFTTNFYAAALPAIKLVPKNHPGRIIGADANLKGQRIDTHSVKLTFNVPRTLAEKIADANDKVEARRKELLKLAEEKQLPTLVELKGAKAERDLGTRSPAGRVQDDPAVKRVIESSRRRIMKEADGDGSGDSSAPSTKEIERRTYENFKENQSRRIDQRLLDELRRRNPQ